MTLSACDIVVILMDKFSTGHACFREFRSITGYGNARYIDFVAVGLWEKTVGIKSFEIKIDRQDFIVDASRFETKHADALDFSHEFYYVTPWGLVEPSEVPEKAGLFWVTKTNALRRKKHAPRQEMKAIEFHHFLAFAREFGNKISHSKIPVKYLNREIEQSEFKEMVKKEAGEFQSHMAREKARELNEKLHDENRELRELKHRIKRLALKDRYFSDAPDDEIIRKAEAALSIFNDLDKVVGLADEIKRKIGEIK